MVTKSMKNIIRIDVICTININNIIYDGHEKPCGVLTNNDKIIGRPGAYVDT